MIPPDDELPPIKSPRDAERAARGRGERHGSSPAPELRRTLGFSRHRARARVQPGIVAIPRTKATVAVAAAFMDLQRAVLIAEATAMAAARALDALAEWETP